MGAAFCVSHIVVSHLTTTCIINMTVKHRLPIYASSKMVVTTVGNGKQESSEEKAMSKGITKIEQPDLPAHGSTASQTAPKPAG